MKRYISWPMILPFLFLPIYGSGYIAGSFGVAVMPPFAMTFWRFVIAGIVMLAITLIRRTPWPRSWSALWPMLVVGLLLQVAQFGGNYTAMGLGMPAGLASLIAGSSSLMMAIGAVPYLHERLTGWRLVGVFVGFAGVAIALADHLGVPSGVAGILASLCAAVGYAAGTLLQRRRLAQVDIWQSVTIQFAVAAPVTLGLASLNGGIAIPLTGQALGALAWIGLVNSVLGMWLLGQMLRHHSAAAVSAWSNLIPPFTALLAIPFLGQSMSVSLAIGLVVALAGTGMVVMRRRPLRAVPGHPALVTPVESTTALVTAQRSDRLSA